MTAIGPALFSVVLWGAILGVAGVFCYECYTVAADAGLVAPTR